MLHPRTPRLTKHKGRYSLIFYDPVTQRRKWISLGTESKTVAERRARPMVAAYERQEWNPFRDWWGDPVGLKAALAAWESAKRQEGARPRTIENTKWCVDQLADLVPAGLPLDAITARDAEKFIRRPTSISGQHSYRRTLAAFFSWCMAAGLASHNPAREVRLPRQTRKVPRYLSRAEAATVLKKEQDPGIRSVIRFAIGSGLRRGELVALAWEDIDRDRGTIHVRGETAKGRADRIVPLSTWSRDALDEATGTSTVYEYTTDYLSHRVGDSLRDAGIADASLHTLRHTFASWLRIGGAPLDRIQYWLGHRTITTTEIYAHLDPVAVAGELEAAFTGGFPG